MTTIMNNDYTLRLNALRDKMTREGIAAVIIPQADPHLSEYLASHWQVRRWFSGFTGSAGDLVVTLQKAALWTDSRYFLQAAEQLQGSGIELMKDGLLETPDMASFLADNLDEGSVVAVDGMLFARPALVDLKNTLAKAGMSLRADFDPAEGLWLDRPELPDSPVFVHQLEYAGESASCKIEKIVEQAQLDRADAVLMSALDDIAWTLNIRSDDVKHTPVATAFLYLSPGASILFINPAKLNMETTAYLASQGVDVIPYDGVTRFLNSLPESVKVSVDANRTAARIFDILGSRAVDTGVTTAAVLKSVKNDTQLQCVRRAMVRDGVALVKAFMEIESRLAEGIRTEETDIAEILRRYRAQGKLFTDESFGTIAGYGPHGAIVHYEAVPESSSVIEPRGLLLIDSGAQYLDGTTDITRTIALGTPTAEEKRDFTLVMKGHIALAKAVFPAGTRGAQLDVLARQFLWQNGLNYLHGTGHGVGFFLGVHEGPHSIRLNNVEAPLMPGSITSNEPGLYRAGVHGIRCENLVLCRKHDTTDFGDFLSFETLTLFPFDRSLFDTSIMTADEIEWVDSYHATVRQRLADALENDSQRKWLEEHTQPLCK